MKFNLHLQNRGERLSIIALIFIGVCLVLLSIRSVDETYESASRLSWMQSTERDLRSQNERYYNDVYDRYSKINRDLTNYQRLTNKRIESANQRLEEIKERIKELESEVGSLEECTGENDETVSEE